MEEFLPSEIARAVYGYLVSEGCEGAATSFLENSPNLVECKQRVKHGKRLTHANTLLLGKSLVEVLNIACSVHSIVKQIHGKQQKGLTTDGHESLTELLDQLRSCVMSDSRVEENTTCSQPLSQPDPQCLAPSPHLLRTPPSVAVSLAENYRSLVQECSEGLDLSLSPEKNLLKNKNVESPCRQTVNRPTSAPGSLGLTQLEMENESAVAAITGFGITPVATSEASTSSRPVDSNFAASSAVVIATTVSKVTTVSHPTPSDSLPPTTLHKNHLIGPDGLPDPPIIVLNSQNQSFEGGDTSTGYFNMPPCAASTPQPRPIFAPEDTAIILYPPLSTDIKPKKVPLKEKTNLRRSGRLRKILPKPPRKDPPNIVHVKVLPQTIEEENEEDADEANEMELAQQLPESEENVILENEKQSTQEEKVEVEKHMEVVTTTSDKENISDENLLREEFIDKSSNNLATDCVKETSTPKPPPLRKHISRSTPRRNSHVRALSFNTPLKGTICRKSNTSPKMPKIKFSPHSSKLSCVKRSSLFSPKNDKELSHLSEEDMGVNDVEKDTSQIVEGNHSISENSPLYKVPIATRSPAPKLSSAWQEVNDVKITEKPVWDEKIRSFALGDFEDPAPPPKKGLQDKQANVESSPNKVKNKSPISSNNKSLRSSVESSCQKKTSRSKKACNTPEKNAVMIEEIKNVKPPNSSIKKKNTSARGKAKNRTKKSSVMKNQQLGTNTNPKEIHQQLIDNPQINTEQTKEKVIEVTSNVEDRGQENKNTQDNILLEDLVVSSNSCFPPTNDESRIEGSCVKVPSQIRDGNQNHPLVTLSTNNSSSSFIQPNMMILETPSKDFQVSCDPKMLSLTTPMVKSVRQETSILEEDLLLTPSLPPTPQINSSPRYTETPCKTATESPKGNKTQAVLKENESNLTQKKVIEPSPSKDLSSLKEKDNTSSCSIEEDEIGGNRKIENTFPPTQTCPMLDKNKTTLEIIKSNCRPSLTTTSESSEDENYVLVNSSGNSPSKSKITLNDKNKKGKMPTKPRNRIYSTSESSEGETNSTKSGKNSYLKKAKLSKLAAALLENERKSLNQKSKKTETNKKVKVPSKKQTYPSPESVSSSNSNKKTKGLKKLTKKASNRSFKVDKSPNLVKEKSLKSKEFTEKQATPESMRQQLQSDLLKCERKIIFGDGFPSSSDSETDLDIFEKKKNVTSKTKVNKGSQKKKISSKIILSEDSSSDNLNKECPSSGKCVRFNPHPAITLSSPDLTQKTLLTSSPKMSPFKKPEKSPLINLNNPSLPKKSSQNLGKGKTDEIPAIINGSNELHGRDSVPAENSIRVDQTSIESIDNSANSQLKKTSVDNSLKQSPLPIRWENDFKKITPTKFLSDNQMEPTNKSPSPNTNLRSLNLLTGNNNSTTDSIKMKGKESETEVREASCLSLPLGTHRLHSQNKNEGIEEPCSQSNDKEGENEICITSTSSCKNMKNTTSSLCILDIDRRDTFQIDEGNVVLSYSKIIKHHYYSPIQRSELVKNDSSDKNQPETLIKNIAANKKISSKEQAVKRRIELIPIKDDKYEQKLQVDYDVFANKIINYRRNRRVSSEIDILDCSTSSILSSDTGCEKQNLNLNQNQIDLIEEKQGSTQDAAEKEESADVNERIRKPKTFKEKVINEKLTAGGKLLDDTIKYNKYRNDREIRREIKNESRSKIQRSRYSHHHNERDVQFEGGRYNSRYKKKLPSPAWRREREGDSRCGRSHDWRDRRRNSERWRRESDRRGYSERRNYSTHSYLRRSSSSDNQTSRDDTKSHLKSRVSNCDSNNVEKIKESLSKLQEHDLDRVDNLEKSQIERLVNQDKVDPRAAQVLSYSDVERNDSSRDEADSLMDFAVITKTKSSRTPENLSKDSPRPTSSQSESQSPSSSSKRKAPSVIGESSESCHVEKKLKLGEVEMKEAKSVLKHKMADMLNVLHPDTSNEAS